MLYKTSSLYKSDFKNGIIIWSARDLEHLKELINQKIDLLFNAEVDDYIDLIHRYGKDFKNEFDEPNRGDIFLSMEQILLNTRILIT